MAAYQETLDHLLELTEAAVEQAKTLDPKMENNDDGQLRALQMLFDRRQEAIETLADAMEQPDFHWTAGDRQVIAELKEHEARLQPLINELHQSFLAQMNRISQTRQASRKYAGAYQSMATEGSFIDKRK